MVALQDTVAVPELVTLPGVIAPQTRPDGAVLVRVTIPEKALMAVIVIVELADRPTFNDAGEDAVMLKSAAAANVNVAVAVWTVEPLVPVIVTTNEPGVVDVHARVAVPDPVTLVGVMVPHVRPEGTVSVRATVPVKPLSAVIVMVEVALAPALTVDGDVAAIEKSAAFVKVNVAAVVCDREPLVPVIVTVYVFAIAELQTRSAVPPPVMLFGTITLHVSPVGTVSVKLTAPAKPFRVATVIVEVADVPTVEEGGEVAAIVKSTKLNAAVVEWVIEPLVPVMLSVNVPAVAELQDTVAVPDPITLPGEIAPQVIPEGMVSVMLTVPEKPFTAETVIVDVADEPASTAVGLVALIVKSATAVNVKVAVVVWVSDPLLPVTVTETAPVEVEEHDKLAEPVPVTLLGVIAAHVKPDGTVSVRPTVPEKPFCPVTVIVELREDPIVPDGEVAAIVKSTTVKVAVAEWVREPLVPVTVRT
jgi:hypothetical protein